MNTKTHVCPICTYQSLQHHCVVCGAYDLPQGIFNMVGLPMARAKNAINTRHARQFSIHASLQPVIQVRSGRLVKGH